MRRSLRRGQWIETVERMVQKRKTLRFVWTKAAVTQTAQRTQEAEAPTDAAITVHAVFLPASLSTRWQTLCSRPKEQWELSALSHWLLSHTHIHTHAGMLAYSEAGTVKHVIMSTHTDIHMEKEMLSCKQWWNVTKRIYSSTVLYNLEVFVIYLSVSIFCYISYSKISMSKLTLSELISTFLKWKTVPRYFCPSYNILCNYMWHFSELNLMNKLLELSLVKAAMSVTM